LTGDETRPCEDFLQLAQLLGNRGLADVQALAARVRLPSFGHCVKDCEVIDVHVTALSKHNLRLQPP
jgi:hypothetical protein